MSAPVVGGLLELAVMLASGFMLCGIAPLRAHLRRQPPPVPYFTFLAFGVAWWMAVPAVISALTALCGWMNSAPFLPGLCLPTAGGLLRGIVEQGGGPVADGEWRNELRSANVFISAFAVWLVSRAMQTACRRIKLAFRPMESGTPLEDGWEFEKMVDQAIGGKMLLMLTLRNRKVYIGRPYRVFPDDSRRDKWVGFFPWQSGYRKEADLALEITTDYVRALGGEEQWEKNLRQVAISLPLREIAACQFYNPALHELFNAAQNERFNAGRMREQTPDEEAGAARTEGRLARWDAKADAPRRAEHDGRQGKENSQ